MTGTALSPLRIVVAAHFHQRLLGWMGRRHFPVNEGLLLNPCNAVHGFFMRAPIDVVFLDRFASVVRVQALQPWHTARCRRAHMTLELAHGAFVRIGPDAVERSVARALYRGSRSTFARERR
ncbi:DUF192 domain-containing protein [Aquabacterium sp. A7-Y]|uniref:DUF192 domain-containing protein n=1 Tax=Aquabacterium sp. A7-Y TaxID=1349605 RepID=UPI00223E458F|nr:DUF192 domain-containing protein [Aquabacterium sp. A7-Y]MCW7540695.1 DUF192 domain-containing protein [Aquabacterium sp. A7-Y]